LTLRGEHLRRSGIEISATRRNLKEIVRQHCENQACRAPFGQAERQGAASLHASAIIVVAGGKPCRKTLLYCRTEAEQGVRLLVLSSRRLYCRQVHRTDFFYIAALLASLASLKRNQK
jgi:hypothetical protein